MNLLSPLMSAPPEINQQNISTPLIGAQICRPRHLTQQHLILSNFWVFKGNLNKRVYLGMNML